jgi:uncharacterized protein (DUF2126 family)/transglutaminase-like putative cysteine protease
MTIRVGLTHRTHYRYDRPVVLSPQTVRLRPAPHSRTEIVSYALKIGPEGHFINWQQDPQGNYVARLVFPEKVSEFSVEVDLVANIAVFNPFDFFLEPEAEQFPFAYDPVLASELAPFLKVEPAGPLLSAWLAKIDRSPKSTADFVVGLNAEVQRSVNYLIRMEPGVYTPEETLERGSGSCRDSAWLLVQILRHLGLAARFVSGYLIQLVADQKPLEGPAGPTSDFTDLHAWAEVYLPGAGWIGLDATSGLLTGEGHIPLACTPEPASAAAISGAVEQCEVSFDYLMEVKRVFETPRVTKPYDAAQWQAIDKLGQEVDRWLDAGDVRLTMGGEPTFVSLDDPQGAEWNTDAVGPTKRERAFDLICRLRERYAPRGLLTFGQGKWYPGEPLPRWAFALTWRGDEAPLWEDLSLVAKELAPDQPNESEPDDEVARLFGEKLAAKLDIDPEYLLPAYEDPIHFALAEQKLPLNVDPFDSKLDDAQERARMLRVFRHGLARPVGFVLPMQQWQAKDGPRWISGPWPLRRERLYLLAGDSPMGLRLPLDSLPHIDSANYPYFFPADPFAPRGPLPARAPQGRIEVPREKSSSGAHREQVRAAAAPAARLSASGRLISDTVRTALGIELRDGKLCLFMPPTETAEGYVSLVQAIEEVADELGQPVSIEGYSPPGDARLNSIKVTPDPGVIEVNIQPAKSWNMLRDNTLALYQLARESHLTSEKFMIDGRHVGTGGGNHIVVGGAEPADSPFLRRPDLLASLVRFWQNHPSLSYLFSGLFIGPTSQAPRVDEARDDAVYELEIALQQIPPAGTDVPPWLVDRILRNVLVDVTGNTHRTEICIDKLYSPDGPTGRLGLVEFRGFEMPPHAEMSCVQQLLLRALIARFWQTPYQAPLIHWGNSLRDRFMLPHFVWTDFKDVLGDLAAHGFRFEESWFAPHLEFRFPLYGKVRFDAIEIELRLALEPWHVMGEEPGPGGTVRYVDSSVERLQVRVSGLSGERHWVTCNGRALPLTPTGTPGESVAGVRFRAWRPPSCLHPTIGVQTPLVFDLVDRWNKRSIGGCTYHVTHPGGRNYETYPVNSNEAEGRRLSRFVPFGHRIGSYDPPQPEYNRHFPATLDLRLARD